ncbi:DUF4325 domain-containing protein [Clostridium bovifaecis]|uniref:DUF4325 domain-containing protein n=1 Tax=Clostridium bovifaecis TaxID=2184719 RepID=A0A6I6EZD6_9CLOT|nr:DUF4325 domain-containing protein [Clostridium bovifaecis]
MKEIMIKDVLGTNVKLEDAIILKRMMDLYIDNSIVLDFENIKDVSCAFFATLLTELFCKKGREYVLSHLKVKNLTNTKAFDRVAYGTSFHN